MEEIKNFLLSILKGMVDNPDAIELHFSDEVDDQGEIVIINVKLAREDVGMCIGQKGSTAEAIRKVVGLVGYKQCGKRIYVKIDAPKMPKNHFEFQQA